MAVPSLMAARWVGRKSGPIFAICGPNYAEFSFPVRECQQFAMPFLIDDVLLHSGDSCEVVRNHTEVLMFLGEGATQISD